MLISYNKKYHSTINNYNTENNDSKEKEDVELAFLSKKSMSYNPSDNIIKPESQIQWYIIK